MYEYLILNKELKLYILYNNHTSEEHIVTMKILERSFSRERITKMLNGNDKYWNLLERFN